MRRFLVLVTALAVVACSPSDGDAESATIESLETTTTTAPETTTSSTSRPFGVTSPEFSDGGAIPTEFTCDGADVSPPLEIVGIPEGTESLVILVDDPDAPVGTWDHWVEFDIVTGPGPFDVPRDTGPLGVQGSNSWNLEGYGGPCPPAGDEAHTYHFHVYAVGGLLDLPTGVDGATVRTAMEGRVIDSVELTGTYSR
ncbi:MAG: YbhB/YbcL family Raf kinase inhibitor-like protein [Acidimicrobiia bacterium]|jgi:hypothetical protein